MQHSVGVLGGLGPAATAYFMQQVISFTEAKTDQEHINMLVMNHATIADRSAFILGQSNEDPLPQMINDAVFLQQASCDFIVIPCNTAHYFYDDIERHVHIPVLNIVKETVLFIKARDKRVKTIGVLATNGTIESESYQQLALANELDCIVLDKPMQNQLMSLIYNQVKAGKEVGKAEFFKFADWLFAQGADCVILGCTELSVVKRDLNLQDERIIDSIDVLAMQTVLQSNKKLANCRI